MPRRPTAIEIRLENIVIGLTSVIPLLKGLNDAFSAPFVPAISMTVASLIAGIRVRYINKQKNYFNHKIQTVRKNKEDCVRMLEEIHVVLYAILELHIRSETPGSLPPTMLYHIGKFTEYHR